MRYLSCVFVVTIVATPAACLAREGHDHGGPNAATHAASTAPPEADQGQLTGSSHLRLRYHAELSDLPERVAAGIKRAHGGFAKTPSVEIYFGLEGTGLVRISADLHEKKLVSRNASLLEGGLHNTTYVERDGEGLLVLPDNNKGVS